LRQGHAPVLDAVSAGRRRRRRRRKVRRRIGRLDDDERPAGVGPAGVGLAARGKEAEGAEGEEEEGSWFFVVRCSSTNDERLWIVSAASDVEPGTTGTRPGSPAR
jgi:hypothetical protein